MGGGEEGLTAFSAIHIKDNYAILYLMLRFDSVFVCVISLMSGQFITQLFSKLSQGYAFCTLFDTTGAVTISMK